MRSRGSAQMVFEPAKDKSELIVTDIGIHSERRVRVCTNVRHVSAFVVTACDNISLTSRSRTKIPGVYRGLAVTCNRRHFH